MRALTIRSIETIPVKVDLARTYKGSHYQMPRRCTVITRVHTEEGVIGESYNADEDGDQAELVRIITDELAPMLIGADAGAIEARWADMHRITLDQLRDRRLAMLAIACVDSALWDTVGKALDTPLYRLWGGYRSVMPIIGIGGYYTDDPHSIEHEVQFFVEKQMAGMKFKVGKASPLEDIGRLKRAVAVAPEDFTFMVDANQAWTAEQAIAFVDMANDFVRLRWFEEPCLWPNDRRAMRDVRLRANVPIAAGQSEIDSAGIRDLIVDGAIDVSNFDASWGGGPTNWRRVAALAATFGVGVGHHEEAQISSHLLASVPHGTYIEVFDTERDPIFWQMLANRPKVTDGTFSLPTGAGFGWELDQGFIDRYRVDR